jgi:type I restriction enzyme S subunit
MVANMEVRSLGDLVDPERGITYGIVQPGQHVRDGVPIVRVTDIREGQVSSQNPLRVAPEIASRYRRTALRGGELLLTLVGTVGEMAVVPAELTGWNTARAVAVIPVCTDPGARWVQYALKTGAAREYIDARLNTTVQATLNLRDVSAFPVPIPDRARREAILRILGALDDKIELNRRMNETLEAMARALFKSWFIDFDPVRAKMAGRSPAGMDAGTAALFPDRLEKSSLGLVPRGWPTVPLGDVLELKRGYDLPNSARKPGGVPIVSSSGISGYHDEAKARGPGVVTGRYGTIGEVFLVWEDFWPLNTALYIMDFKGSDPLFAYYVLRNVNFEKFSDKGAVPGINRNHLHMEPVCVPLAPVQCRFGELVHPWLTLARENSAQSRTLADLRDTLLPRLLSGELRIRDAEREVENVA